jgi:methionyl-tRNA formyltransferase
MKYIFIGNRKFVLEEMINQELNIVDIIVVANSHLEYDIKYMDCKYTLINTKKELLKYIDELNYDVLVSNGCPYILPISKMGKKLFINIHPSFLPDLKGADPVIGSVLFRRDGGVTCHIMDETIDGGDIIAQVKIPFSLDLNATLLYQLSFIAEKEVFTKALYEQFRSIESQKKDNSTIYYTRIPEDKCINFGDSVDTIINKIKAFNNKSQGAIFKYKNVIFKVFDIKILTNQYLNRYALDFEDLIILFCYEDSIIFKKDDNIIQFNQVIGDLSIIDINSYINVD